MIEKRQDSGWPHPEDVKTVLAYKPFRDARDLSDPVKKVYISRKNSRRSPKNEGKIEEYFASIGFQIVELEKLNLIDEIKLISSVKVLAGIHGAGLANQIWMKEGGIVIDIVNEEYWTESIFRLAALSKNRYIPIPFKLNSKGEVPLAAIFQSVNDCL
jgi:capsular polysaccharide biosynthesis protein